MSVSLDSWVQLVLCQSTRACRESIVDSYTFGIILRLHPTILSIQLRPFRELILRTRSTQFLLQPDELPATFRLQSNVCRGRGVWKLIPKHPQLEVISVAERLANNQAVEITHEFINDGRSNGINEMYDDLEHKHYKKQRRHSS